MKTALTILFFLSGIALFGQCKVYKTNGEIVECEIVKPGKTVTCISKGKDKIKIPVAEVLYYTYKDSTKSIIDENGYKYACMIENDSVYLVERDKEIDGRDVPGYYLIRKSGKICFMEIKKTVVALDVLKKYFGGSCPGFDEQIEKARPNFTKIRFSFEDWDYLINYYSRNCQKK